MSFGYGFGSPRSIRSGGFFVGGTVLDFTQTSVATLRSLGVTNNVATTNPPGTITLSNGNIDYGASNSIRNSTMAGAVAGSPGTVPTNWTITPQGLSYDILGTGTENGWPYIDIRFYGTKNTANAITIAFDTATGIAAADGQSWGIAAYVKFISGTAASSGLSGMQLSAAVNNSGGTYLTQYTTGGVGGFLTLLTTSLARFSGVITIANASTAYIRPQLSLLGLNGAVIEITLRIAAPSLNRGGYVADYLNTTSGAVYGPRLTYVNGVQGLLSEEARTNLLLNSATVTAQGITVTSGATYTISFYGNGSSVTFSGAYAGTVTCTTGRVTQTFTAATTTLTIASTTGSPVFGQVELGAFATSWIPTSTAAVTRSGDDNRGAALLPYVNTGAGTMGAEYIPNGDTAAVGRSVVELSSAGTNIIRLQEFAGVPGLDVYTAGVAQAQLGVAVASTRGTLQRSVGRWATNNFGWSLNGAAALTDTSGTVPTVDTFRIGNGSFYGALNGVITKLSLTSTVASNTQLQQLSAGTLA